MSLLVVADNSPVAYLCEIGQIDLLPRLFGEIHIPAAVYHELCHPGTPAVICCARRKSLPSLGKSFLAPGETTSCLK